MRKALFVALALAVTAPAHAEDDLYTKVAARLAADPTLAARLGKPGPEMQSVGWMIGTWDVVAEVQAGERPPAPEHGTSTVTPVLGGTVLQIADTYPKGTQDLGFLGYGPATQRWTATNLDSIGNAVTISGGFNNEGLVVEGDVVIVGIQTHLRQIMRREGDRAYTVTNAERAADGSWRVLDIYRYTKR